MASEADIAKLVGRLAATRSVAARAAAHNPDDVRALFGAGAAFRITGDYPSALTQFIRAAELDPANPYILFELGMVREQLGQFDAAAQAYTRSLAAAPDYYKARLALIQLQKQTAVSNSIATLEAQFAGPDQDGWRTLHIGHALAKTYEDFGDVATSFAWLGRAKARRHALRAYDDTREVALSQAAMRTAAQEATGGYESDEPIFVAGLPRTGTTLVDRILSSHADVSSAGEIPNFVQLFKLMSGSTTPALLDPDTLERAGQTDLAGLGRLYIDSTRTLTGATPRFVDKAPSNYLLAGVILRALPNARLVCLRRHPLDAVLSNYKQIFPMDDSYYDYVYALESAAQKFVRFDRVVKHWRATLPADRFLEIGYEDLVTNQEAATRRLIAFCGLTWDDRCLAFHENTGAVATPSAVQVRSAMYASAMGRWAKYGALLDPARGVLEQAGVPLD